jgi:hypothetical protein
MSAFASYHPEPAIPLSAHSGRLASIAELTRKQLRRGVHTSTRQLEADIRAFIARHNQHPKPYKWTQSADQILSAVKCFCQKTQNTLCGEL